VPPQVIAAYFELKRAAAMGNAKLRELPKDKAQAIVDACERLLEDFADRRGEVMRHFPIDIFQTGSGTSTNMNVNEVIANTASTMRGKAIGSKDPLHPNDHVNCGQSSNDTFPTAMQIAGAVAIQARLVPALKELHRALATKARAWDRHVKIGRTHLMDATPIRVGQEFSGYAAAVAYGVARAELARDVLARNLPIGGTAVGTGINANPKLAGAICATLTKDLGVRFEEAKNHFEAQATRDCVVEASGLLKTIAVSLSKIANDIRWLGSGPRCGLGELILPATQPGSSIMPGKVNPVICESVIQVACRVVGNDAAITLGGFGGVGSLLELNTAMPLIADDLLESIELLAAACSMFASKCIDGLELHPDATRTVERSLMMVTSLAPAIGYDRAAKVAKEAYHSGETIREHVLKHQLVDAKTLDRLLEPRSMTRPGGKGPGGG
jgi:fumarate hydratase class II